MYQVSTELLFTVMSDGLAALTTLADFGNTAIGFTGDTLTFTSNAEGYALFCVLRYETEAGRDAVTDYLLTLQNTAVKGEVYTHTCNHDAGTGCTDLALAAFWDASTSG